ncbi:GntR family transcriptional regulator [Microbacterium sp. p3-SID336]|uniref:GntR family transcriptional regulator n=1 Tax=Microbacterium sp. p3-SID336 TaxID=2916212 RepID=UPI0021A8CBEF|nr:GntR family transcriptional regulator [Microbacterium sp. p3-SID336]MCT1478870.1 GntR family transcriptional regulator [Microbacterium sp. p3-SID336]
MDDVISPTVAHALTEIRGHLKRGIRPGAKLPSERILAEQVGVSRATLRLALGQLEQEGVLTRHPQRGWFVRGNDTFSDRASELQSFSELATSRGFTAESEVLALARRTATIEEAERLRIPPVSSVIELNRLRKLDGIPVCVDEAVLVGNRCEPVLQRDFTTASLYEALETDCDISVYRSSCTIQARGATAEQARLLNLEEGDPVLVCDERTTTADGTIVLTSRLTYRWDSYRFTADLYRS